VTHGDAFPTARWDLAGAANQRGAGDVRRRLQRAAAVGQALILGLQNVCAMTGMWVFPGLPGRAFNLDPGQIAYIYGMSIPTCGMKEG